MCRRRLWCWENVGQTSCSLSDNDPGIYPQEMMKMKKYSQDKWHQPRINTYTTYMQINHPLAGLACSQSLDAIFEKLMLSLHSGAIIEVLQMRFIQLRIFNWLPCSRIANMRIYLIQIYYTAINYLSSYFGKIRRN
jgi:hypothetical protein